MIHQSANRFRFFKAWGLCAAIALILTGCRSKEEGNGDPPPAKVVEVTNMTLIAIPAKDVAKFPVVKAGAMEAPAELNATGTVFPDVSREVPVISLANGRVVDIKTDRKSVV